MQKSVARVRTPSPPPASSESDSDFVMSDSESKSSAENNNEVHDDFVVFNAVKTVSTAANHKTDMYSANITYPGQ